MTTIVKTIEATQRRSSSVPAMTFGHLTHILSTNTVWDVRIGRRRNEKDRQPEDDRDQALQDASSRIDGDE